MTGGGGDDAWRRALLEAARASGASKAKAGPDAARSQDFPYGDAAGPLRRRGGFALSACLKRRHEAIAGRLSRTGGEQRC